LGPRAAAGDREAINELAGVDPEMAMQYRQYSDQQRAAQAEAQQARGQEVARLLQMVNKSPEDQKEKAYSYARRHAMERLGVSPERMPERYDPRFMDAMKARFGMGQRDKKTFGNERSLRSEYTKLSKPFMEVRDAYGRVLESVKEPSAAGDMALIFNYMKMLDPGSTVREGEFATAAQAQGVPDRIRSAYNRVISGERLSPSARKDFFGRAEMLFGRQKATQDAISERYKDLAARNQLDPENVVIDFGVDYGEKPTFGEEVPAEKEEAETVENLPQAESVGEPDFDELIKKYAD